MNYFGDSYYCLRVRIWPATVAIVAENADVAVDTCDEVAAAVAVVVVASGDAIEEEERRAVVAVSTVAEEPQTMTAASAWGPSAGRYLIRSCWP